MDDRLRELERRATAGDEEARQQADVLRIRIGEAPSLDFLLKEQERVVQLQQQYLFDAVEREIKNFFERHGPISGIKALAWGIFPRDDCHASGKDAPTNWDIEGLLIEIDNEYWDDICYVSPWCDLDFQAQDLISHLKNICNCGHRCPDNRYRKICNCEGKECWIGNFDHLNIVQKQALSAALRDALVLASRLFQTDLKLLHKDADAFSFIRETGQLSAGKHSDKDWMSARWIWR